MRISILFILLFLSINIYTQNIIEYSFDQINGDNTITDNSGNNRAGTVNGSSIEISNSDTINGSYLSFPTTNEHIEYQESDLVTQDESFTVSFLFKVDEFSDEDQYLYSLYTGNYSGSFHARIVGSTKRLDVRLRQVDGTFIILGSAILNLTSNDLTGKWNHFVLTHNASTKTSYLFLNGELQQKQVSTDALRNIDGFTLGANANNSQNVGYTSGLNGHMDEFVMSKNFIPESDIVSMPSVLFTNLVITSGCHTCNPMSKDHVFSVGDEITYRVIFSKDVDVIGTPKIKIGDSYAYYNAIKSSSSILYFRYTLTSNDLIEVTTANDLFYGRSIEITDAIIEEKNNVFGFSRVPLNLSHPFDIIYPNTISKKEFLGDLDYSLSFMESVKTEYDAGNYDEALKIWRDIVVNRFRAVDFIGFSWHDNALNSYYTNWAQYINGELSDSDYLTGNKKYSLDYQNLKGFIDNDEQIDWDATRPTVLDKEETTYLKFNSFPNEYWKNNNSASRDSWFKIVADFSQRHKAIIDNKWESMTLEEQDAVSISWRARQAQSALDQGLRYINVLKSIGLFSKNLEGETFISSWSDVLSEKRAPVTDRALTDLIDEELLMQIVTSLVRDYPEALLERYDRSDVVPNQRLNGLLPVFETAILFPELNESYADITTAKDAFQRYLDDAIHHDGGMLEQSINYNVDDRENLEILINVINDVPTSAIDPSLISDVEKVVHDFERLEYSLHTPHMSLPLIGNNSHSEAGKIWNDTDEREDWIGDISNLSSSHTLENSIIGDYKNDTENTLFHSIVFPYSGYNVLRNGWSWDDSYLFMNTAKTSNGHQSADNNAVQIFAYGRSLLQSDGSADYYNSLAPLLTDNISEYSSFKVNTVMVDGLSQAKPDILYEVTPNTIGDEFSLSKKIDYTQGNYDQGYGTIQDKRVVVVNGINHNREVVFLKDFNLWLISDKMENTNNTTHTYSQVWNFPGEDFSGFLEDEVNVDVVNKKIHTSDAGEPNLLIQNFCDVSNYTQLKYYNDQVNYLGFMSAGGKSALAPDVHVEWEATGNTILGTVIKPYETEVSSFDIEDKSEGNKLHLEFISDSKQVVYQNGYTNSENTIGDIAFNAKSFTSIKDGDDQYGFVKDNSSFRFKDQNIDVTANSFQFYYSDADKELTITPFIQPDMFEWSTDDTPVYEVNPSSIQVLDKEALSISDVTSDDLTLLFYPNPTNNSITFRDEALIGSKIELINMTGQLVFSSELLSNELLINNVTSGTYLMVIKNELAIRHRKIIIK